MSSEILAQSTGQTITPRLHPLADTGPNTGGHERVVPPYLPAGTRRSGPGGKHRAKESPRPDAAPRPTPYPRPAFRRRVAALLGRPGAAA